MRATHSVAGKLRTMLAESIGFGYVCCKFSWASVDAGQFGEGHQRVLVLGQLIIVSGLSYAVITSYLCCSV